MQIHELNRKPDGASKQSVNEVDLVGPGSIFNVGRQVLKNPKALVSSPALGAAQQAATQASAASSAQKLAAQGYRVGGSIRPTVTLSQQLQAVRSNPAVQAQVRNLTAQWRAQGAAIVASMQQRRNIPEAAVVISNPEATKDPLERKLLDFIYKQEAAKDAASQATPAAAPPATVPPVTPTESDKADANQKLQEFATAFTQWSDPKLAVRGVTMDQIRNQPEYNKLLTDQLTKIAIQSLANPTSPATTEAISEYFNIAIAAIQTIVNNAQSGTAAPAAQAAAAAPPNDAEILTQLQQQGFSVTKAELEKLGQILTASSGSNAIRNTGNPVLNAIARLAGMRVS